MLLKRLTSGKLVHARTHPRSMPCSTACACHLPCARGTTSQSIPATCLIPARTVHGTTSTHLDALLDLWDRWLESLQRLVNYLLDQQVVLLCLAHFHDPDGHRLQEQFAIILHGLVCLLRLMWCLSLLQGKRHIHQGWPCTCTAALRRTLRFLLLYLGFVRMTHSSTACLESAVDWKPKKKQLTKRTLCRSIGTY